MTHKWRRAIAGAAGFVLLWLTAIVIAAGQAASSEEKPPMAEDVFKNVQVLKGMPVDEFMGTMSVFSVALGMSCEDCHTIGDNWDSYAADTVERKRTARRMILMMQGINRTNFAGRQVVTCYTCHRGTDHPRVTPTLADVYGALPSESSDVITPARGAPPANEILDRYIQALGGPQRLAAVTSFVAKGTSTGYGPEGEKRPVEIFAKAPAERTTIIHTLDGDSITTYDGRTGWIAAPHRPLPVLALTGGELDGVRLDAELSFPSRIKQALTEWRVGSPTTIDDREVQVVQGTSANGTLATFYFDAKSGLLVRQVRYAGSRVGRNPTQVDYTDYRDVAGVKMPFRFVVTWTSGLDTYELTDIRPNVPVDPAKFARPAPAAR